MTVRGLLPAIAAMGALAGVALPAWSAAPAPGGLYSESQAGEGAQVYQQRCAMCHGPALEGTFEVPALTGKFVANWSGRPLGDLYSYLGRAMPQFAPGTLAAEDNARVLAYILRANGYPPGPLALNAASPALRARLPAPVRLRAPT